MFFHWFKVVAFALENLARLCGNKHSRISLNETETARFRRIWKGEKQVGWPEQTDESRERFSRTDALRELQQRTNKLFVSVPVDLGRAKNIEAMQLKSERKDVQVSWAGSGEVLGLNATF